MMVRNEKRSMIDEYLKENNMEGRAAQPEQ